MPKLATLAVLGIAGLPAMGAAPVRAESTLATVKARGQLFCGINGQRYCRAVAAAVLRGGSKARVVPLTTASRLDALRDGSLDVLMRNTTASLERTAHTGVRDATVIYIDVQSGVVPKTLNVKELAELDGKTVCVLHGTPYLPRLQEWFAERKRGANALWSRGGVMYPLPMQ
jgi:general L-amino acid transport system substrate-binding protein